MKLISDNFDTYSLLTATKCINRGEEQKSPGYRKSTAIKVSPWPFVWLGYCKPIPAVPKSD